VRPSTPATTRTTCQDKSTGSPLRPVASPRPEGDADEVGEDLVGAHRSYCPRTCNPGPLWPVRRLRRLRRIPPDIAVVAQLNEIAVEDSSDEAVGGWCCALLSGWGRCCPQVTTSRSVSGTPRWQREPRSGQCRWLRPRDATPTPHSVLASSGQGRCPSDRVNLIALTAAIWHNETSDRPGSARSLTTYDHW